MKSIDRAFLYMHDIPSSYSAFMVCGSLVKAILKINEDVFEMVTPRSRTKEGRSAYFDEMSRKALQADNIIKRGSQDVTVIIEPDSSILPFGNTVFPRVWNPFTDHNSPEQDFIGRCEYVYERCKKIGLFKGGRFSVRVGTTTIFEDQL